MKRLLPSLVLLSSASASAQTRVRPMGEFRAESKGVSIVAVFEARSTHEFVIDANERIDEASFFSSVRCTVGADAAMRWADSTIILINQQPARPRAPDKMRYEGPQLASDDCVIRVDRTVDAAGSTFGLTVLSRELMHHASAIAPVTQAQALAFIGKVRGTAAVTLAMSSVTPGSPMNPLVVVDASPTPPRSDPAYFEFQVEKPATLRSDSPPPKAANTTGEILAQFVVDTTGRVEIGTFRVLKSTNDVLSRAVKDALIDMRFDPAEVGGRKVRQLVQMPFEF